MNGARSAKTHAGLPAIAIISMAAGAVDCLDFPGPTHPFRYDPKGRDRKHLNVFPSKKGPTGTGEAA
jgi:hypothetical protein